MELREERSHPPRKPEKLELLSHLLLYAYNKYYFSFFFIQQVSNSHEKKRSMNRRWVRIEKISQLGTTNPKIANPTLVLPCVGSLFRLGRC